MMNAKLISEIRGRTGVWTLRVRCPYCRAIHIHGGGNGDLPFYGSRAGDCYRTKGYVVTQWLEYEIEK